MFVSFSVGRRASWQSYSSFNCSIISDVNGPIVRPLFLSESACNKKFHHANPYECRFEWNLVDFHIQSINTSDAMLSLGGEEWTDYFFPAPGSPTRRGYGDDGDSDDDGSLCKSPEPSSPPSSSSVFVDGDDSDWYPRIPSLDMSPGSPRSVRENNLDLSASLCMCVYDLDTLCTTGEESSEFHSSQIFDENQFQNSSKILL